MHSRRWVLCAAFAVAAGPLLAGETMTSTELWAQYVKTPNSHPNLPNCSYAGYHYSETPLPEPKVVANVKDCGAKADGKTDDTAAFAAALKRAADAKGGAVLVPAGTYSLSGMLKLTADGVVLRGEGPDKTILSFEKPLEQVLGANAGAGSSRWSWSGGLIWIGPAEIYDAAGKVATTGSRGFSYEGWQGQVRLAELTAPAKRGDLTVQVDAAGASRLKPGALVLLCWQNPADLSLLNHIAGHPAMEKYDWRGQGAGLVRYPQWRWPVEIVKVEGHTVTLKQPLRIDARAAWKVGFESLGPCVREAGVEKLTVRFPAHSAGRHLQDKGYNGIHLNRCAHCFVRDVTIVNPDNGLIHTCAKNTTITGLVIQGGKHHHATALREGSHDNLITDFRIESQPMHGINTEALSTGNVWRRGELKHGTFDSHCAMSFESLRTDITVNSDGVPGGGTAAGPFLGGRVAHWNIRATGKGEWVNGPDYMPAGALVGIQGVPRHSGCSWHMPPGGKGCVIADEGKVPAIPDLFEAQLKLRLEQKAP